MAFLHRSSQRGGIRGDIFSLVINDEMSTLSYSYRTLSRGFDRRESNLQLLRLLKRFMYGYCAKINTLEDLIESANSKLFLKIHKIISTVSILCYLQLNHRTIISGLNYISTRSQTTPQNYITVPSSHVAYSSIINLSFRLLYIV